MSNHKATPPEAQAGNLKGFLTSSTPPSVATDEELSETWYKAPGERMNRFRAIYNLGIEHGLAGPPEVAEPAPAAGGLVERVAYAIDTGSGEAEARAAILEVAKWLRERHWIDADAPDLLEQEAGR
jgi:hypothetical protein